MATKSNPSAGRPTLTVSLVIGVLGTVATVLLLNGLVGRPGPRSIWFVVGLFLAAGLIGLIAAAIALVKGRGGIRLVAVAGVLLNIYVTLFGAIGVLVGILVTQGLFNPSIFG